MRTNTRTGPKLKMEFLLVVVLVPYYVGQLVAIFVYPMRIGASPVGAYITAVMHPPSRRNGIPWLIRTIVKVIGWPVVLYVWLKDGRPASPVLYGDAAAERLGIDPSRSQAFATKWTVDGRRW